MATANLSNDTANVLHITDCDPHNSVGSVAAVAIAAGQPVVFDSNGKWALADANTQTARGQVFIALRTVSAGAALTASKHVLVEGLGVTGLAFGDPIYLSDTEGAWSSGTPTTGNSFVCGYVEPLFNNGATASKVARVCTL